jgi:hypothetical protein
LTQKDDEMGLALTKCTVFFEKKRLKYMNTFLVNVKLNVVCGSNQML